MTKKLRFEVFKRDNFKCQYCGRKVPDIILEVDHIIPISKGGTNEIANLITSCFDCNRGKSNKDLKQKICREDIDNINNTLKEKELQLKEYYKFQKKKISQIENDIEYINNKYSELTDNEYELSNKSKLSYKQFLKIFSKYEIVDAIELAFVKNVFNPIKYSFGILHNWRKDRNGR